jgi:hypothetical protein
VGVFTIGDMKRGSFLLSAVVFCFMGCAHAPKKAEGDARPAGIKGATGQKFIYYCPVVENFIFLTACLE